ncbi:hypothetical protein, partial [Mobilibacterium timonense]|uniref:hypothetical protein n=1 Tax=Mobilibacterium timonense TaxID=1871012 RepID=UPI002355E1BA
MIVAIVVAAIMNHGSLLLVMGVRTKTWTPLGLRKEQMNVHKKASRRSIEILSKMRICDIDS